MRPFAGRKRYVLPLRCGCGPFAGMYVRNVGDFLSGVPPLNLLPVDDAPERLQVVWPTVLIIKVVRVLPYVEGEERPKALLHGVVRPRLLGDDEGAIGPGRQPHPAAAEKACARRHELGLEGLDGPPLPDDLLGQFSHRPSLGRRPELREIQVVVQDLPRVVEDGTIGLPDNFLQRQALEGRTRQRRIQVVHVPLQVLAVVERQRLCADHRRQSVGGVW